MSPRRCAGLAGARDLAVLLHPARELLLVRPRGRARARARASARSGSRTSRASVNASSPVIAPSRGDLLEELQAALERLGEALLLGLDRRWISRAVLDELGVRTRRICSTTMSASPPRNGDCSRSRSAVLRGPADDAAQHVAAALVRRRDAVADEERHPAAVVGEDRGAPSSRPPSRRTRRRDSSAIQSHDLPGSRRCRRPRARPAGSRAPRSRPMPVSMFCFGSGVSVPSACSSYSMKTRFQNSRKRSQRAARRAVGLAAADAPRRSRSRARSRARTGPGRRPTRSSPSGRARTIRSGGMPIFSQRRDRHLVRAELRAPGRPA